MKEERIKKIIVRDIGGIFHSGGAIYKFQRAGEMANVDWYRQGKREFQGKYVVEIEYF